MNLLVACVLVPQVPIDRLDALAQSRDVAALTQYLAEPPAKNPFSILRTGGGYAAGAMGWHARRLDLKDESVQYVVFSTPIIVEDAGELLFRVVSGGKLLYIPERENLGVVLEHHAFDVSFDLPAHRVSVTDRFRVRRTDAWPHFVFRFSPTFQVSAVSDDAGHALSFAQAGGVVAISAPQQDQTFIVRYSGTVEKPGFANVIGPDEATLSGTVWYPMIARHPSTYDITLHSPANWLALAQGSETSSKVVGNERVTNYRMDLPVVWISATAGPYRRITTKINGIEFSTISARASDQAMRTQNENNATVVDFYSKTFGPYPFKSWTTVDSTQFRNGVGALEAYSFATYPAGGVPFLDTHEPSHTWWGGIVNNDYLASIWNESFANYSQVIFNIDQPIGNREERHRAYVSQGAYTPMFDAAPLARSGQDIGPPATALGYLKGAYVLQVLEDELGSEVFLRCLREWVRTNPVGHIGSWADFEAVVDRVSARDCTWFFDEWVRGKGLPNCSLIDGAWSNGKFSARVAFVGPAYRLTTDAVLEFADGRRTYTRVSIDPRQDGRFTLACAEKPSVVALDPFGKIARMNGGGAQAVTIGRAPRSRVFVDPANPGFLKPLVRGAALTALPSDLDGLFIVGSPETLPALAPLCAKAGFRVAGNLLTYNGTTIDLLSGGALAVVDLPDGKRCLIGLGTCDRRPDTGQARLIVFNRKGQMLRADTDPIDRGPLATKL